MFKKGKKGQTIWKFGQKCTKFENIFKNGMWLCTIIVRNKLVEKALLKHLVHVFLMTVFGFLNISLSFLGFWGSFSYNHLVIVINCTSA